MSGIVLVAVKTLAGIQVREYNYFNYAATTKIIPPTIPKFFEVQIDINDTVKIN